MSTGKKCNRTIMNLLLGILIFFTLEVKITSASSYNYKRPITINNTQNSNSLTDYQILITVDTTSLISAGKMRSDCGDIRFMDSDGTTQLNYWIGSGCDSSSTRIWVKVPSIPASSTKTIYMYYGNSSATSLSNGENTFLAFNLSFDGPIGGRTSNGGWYNCALLSNGSVKCWGKNDYGQLGDGTTTDRHTPVSVSGLTNAVAIATGNYHSCALLSDGTVKCWGDNEDGELGDGTTTSSNTSVSVSGITNAVGIAAGEYHSCALLSDGTMKCWGDNYQGQLGDGTTTKYSDTPVSVSGLTNAVSIATGYLHSCALLSDGTVKCWGNNGNGELGDGTTTDRHTPVSVSGLTNAVAIATGEYHSCALLSNGSVKCWGKNDYGQLGDGTTTDRHTPVSVSGLTNAVAIATGCQHNCALLSDGTVKCWGRNNWGQLGDGTTTDRHTPVSVSGLTNAVAIATGCVHSCALLSDGTVKCWGYNGYGQLGDGTTTDRHTPVSVLYYNLGGRYDKSGGIPSTIQEPPYFNETYFVRGYTSPEPTTSVGNEESTDNEAPSTTITPNGSACTNQDVNFTLSCDDGSGSGCNITYYDIIDSDSSCPSAGDSAYSNGTSGTVTCPSGSACQKKVCYYSTDNAGNTETIQESNIFYIDKAPPTITLESPQNVTYNTNKISINYTALDANLDSCWYELDGTTYSLPNCQNQTITVSNGLHKFTIYANDSAGNQNSTSVNFTADYVLYKSNGNWTSPIKDFGSVKALWYIQTTSSTPDGTSIQTYFRAGNVSTPDSSWTGWTPITNSQQIGIETRYFQILVNLSTTDELVTPSVSKIRVVYG